MMIQQQEAESEMSERLQKMQVEKDTAVELAASLQRSLAAIDAEKKHSERSAIRLEKDKNALKKTLNKVIKSV